MTSITARLVVPNAVQRRQQRYNRLSSWFFVAGWIMLVVFSLLAKH